MALPFDAMSPMAFVVAVKSASRPDYDMRRSLTFNGLRRKSAGRKEHSNSYGSERDDFAGNMLRSQSSHDIQNGCHDGTTPISRRKRFLHKLRQLRPGRDKHRSTRGQQQQVDVSHDPDSTATDLCPMSYEDAPSGGRQPSVEEMDASPNRLSGHRNSGCEDESEVDSGITVVDSSETTALQQRQSLLRTHPFFQLDVVLKEGHELVVRDSCGTSDPYVKFKVGGRQCYKSRIIYKNLNPKWDERFSIAIEDPFAPIQVKVLDYDRCSSDDPMGSAEIDLSSLQLHVPTELRLDLTEKGKPDYLGYLLLECTFVPKTQDDKEQYFRRTMKLGDSAKKLKTQVWSSVITIVLVEGKDLLPMDDNGLSDPYVKFRLGNEKYRSKYKLKTLSPRWLEQFDLHMFDSQTSHLELSVWDHDGGGRDDIMGRASIDLSTITREVTHSIEQPLEDGAGSIKLLLTISGTSGSETVSDLSTFSQTAQDREAIVRKYGLFQSLKQCKNVGWLQVKVFKADGLAAADIGGKSDPFCVLELVNARLQTQTEYKTLSPEWGKVLTFNVKDIHSILEVTVYDEDRDKKCEFLGKVAIPLLKIQCGEPCWYALKDKKLTYRVKGSILLELDIIYNHVKAAIRTFNPREERFMQPEAKFRIATMRGNLDRVSKIVQAVMGTGRFVQSCFQWESKTRSLTAFVVFLLIVWNFELYMLPVTLIILFIKNLIVLQLTGPTATAAAAREKDQEMMEDEDDDEDEDKDKEEKKSFKERLQSIQEVCLQVQEAMDAVASFGERIKNTFNWTVPWLSCLLFIVLTLVAIVLYYIPLRVLLVAWGVNKFTKKLRAPNAIANNELMDFLSRVPSDKELMMYREFRLDSRTGTSVRKKKS